jgi:hypothetical protein
MHAQEKSQIPPLFLNHSCHYDELYVAYFFFNPILRSILHELPWNMPIYERQIIKAARKQKITAPHARSMLGFLEGLDVVSRTQREEIHISLSFDDIYWRRHRIPRKYLRKFFNHVTSRSFCDVEAEVDDEENTDMRDKLLRSISIQSSKFMIRFKHGECISQYMQSLCVPTTHRYDVATALPVIPPKEIIHLYFSILSRVMDIRGFILSVLYETEFPFSPMSVFGIPEYTFSEILSDIRGLAFENGVVWVVDKNFYHVYNVVNQH